MLAYDIIRKGALLIDFTGTALRAAAMPRQTKAVNALATLDSNSRGVQATSAGIMSCIRGAFVL